VAKLFLLVSSFELSLELGLKPVIFHTSLILYLFFDKGDKN